MATKKQTGSKAAGIASKAQKVAKMSEAERAQKLAAVAIRPGFRHALLSSLFANQLFGDSHTPSDALDVDVMRTILQKAQEGDKDLASRMLTAQAVTLDAIFTELGRRSATNMGEYLDATERYMKLALKAQANCRATLEALTKLHQPREQTVKHVHVNEGGQAIVANQIHQHGGRGKNGKTAEQSHTTGTAGQSAPMLGQDAQGNGVPIPGGERAQTVPDARRDQSGRAETE